MEDFRVELRPGDIIHPRCPYCGKKLTSGKIILNNDFRLFGIEFKTKWGPLFLSPIWGNHQKLTPQNMPEGKEIEISCPHCGQTLNTNLKCIECGSSLVLLKADDVESGFVAICSKNGCPNHSVKKELPIESTPEQMII